MYGLKPKHNRLYPHVVREAETSSVHLVKLFIRQELWPLGCTLRGGSVGELLHFRLRV